jgi:hypothetical protein
MKKQSGRKALIALTDGVDNGSKVTLTSAIESAQRADTLVYSILFADPEAYSGIYGGGHHPGRHGGGGYPVGPKPYGWEADSPAAIERNGRRFFEVSKKQPIEKIYDQIQEELRNRNALRGVSLPCCIWRSSGATLRKIFPPVFGCRPLRSGLASLRQRSKKLDGRIRVIWKACGLRRNPAA